MDRLILESFFPYRLTRLGAVVSERLKPIYRNKYGLTIPEWRVLATLGQVNGLTAKQIGRHSAMHKTKVSRAVAKLDERRWLRRSDSARDRREEVLSLTSAGLRAYESICPEMQGFVDRIEERLGREDMALVQTALALLEASLQVDRPDLVPSDAAEGGDGERGPSREPALR